MKTARVIFSFIFFASLIVLGISFFQRDRLPNENLILEELYTEPGLTTALKEPFEETCGGLTYNIIPQYSYEIYGLVVACRNPAGTFSGSKAETLDILNVRNLCLVWGDNISNKVYKSIKFTSGRLNCYFECISEVKQDACCNFSNDYFSGNRFLSTDAAIIKTLKKTRRGDQIYAKGYIVLYSYGDVVFDNDNSPYKFKHGEKPNEIVYLTEFKILSEANIGWRNAHMFSRYVLLVSFIALLILQLTIPLGSLRSA
ncbi:MAG: hypothetical protein PHU64_03695 [Candidatus Omnitrophica bacterium]|nr:hypothetical protein [Candidatus Omnitrophota bacterium]MDD5429630.1 hypothetical protein [Candidatus Omnitrophota bacterium]